MEPRLILHGGAGRAFKTAERTPRVRRSLHAIAEKVWAELESGSDAMEVVVLGCQLLEDDPNFNAGTGSVLQADGQVRLSASLMTDEGPSFSAVINAQGVRHPIAIAHHLQGARDRVLDGSGVEVLARALGVAVWDPIVERRLLEWLEERRGNFDTDHAGVIAEPNLEPNLEPLLETSQKTDFEDGLGTIGVVVRDVYGRICAGTSTGGRGFEQIGRVSDSATPAGNYATHEAGVSCTGVGEDILDEALATRIVVRVIDGAPLHEAVSRSIEEGASRRRRFGAIAVDQAGKVVWGKTTELLMAAYHDGTRIRDTLDATTEVAVHSVLSGSPT